LASSRPKFASEWSFDRFETHAKAVGNHGGKAE